MNIVYNMTADQGVSGSLTRLTSSATGGRFMADRQVAASAATYQCKSCEGHFGANAFYASNQSMCKECVKERVRANRAKKIDYYRSYDRKRYRDFEHRKEAARKSAMSDAAKAARARATARSKIDEPQKWIARGAVRSALRGGKLKRGTECFFCGSGTRIEAHHHDYDKPLDVFWLCSKCHGKLHTINGDFQRGS